MRSAVSIWSRSQSDLPTWRAFGDEERVRHRAADHQRIDLAQQVLEQRDLGRDLRAADHRHHRPLGIAERLVEMGEFLLHRAPGRGRQQMRDAFGRRVRAMRGAERVVDEDVAEFGDLLREGRIVLLFAGMEARVLQKKDIAVLQLRDGRFRDVADAIVRERDRTPNGLRQRRRDRLQRHGRHDLALRPVEVGQHDHARALFRQLADRGRLAVDAQRVGDLAVLHRHVQVGADEDALSLHVQVIECAECRHEIDLQILRAGLPGRSDGSKPAFARSGYGAAAFPASPRRLV